MAEKKPTILIIEDETSLLRVLSDQLQDEGFRVLTATDGKIGLDTALAKHPDLIFLDVVMPHMDGMAMLQELRANEWGQHVPVVILTNVSEAERIDDLMSKGISAYIVKADWELDDVVRIAKDALNVHAVG